MLPVFAAPGLLPAAPQAQSAPLRVMLLSGSNNHNWRATTPELCATLRECGRFQVDVIEDVAALNPPDFAPYDVVVSNFNTFQTRAIERDGKRTHELVSVPVAHVWDEAVREAFLARIRAGGGFVVVHAGSCCFYDWPEFQRLAATTWTYGRTSHGLRHAAPVTFTDAEHPVTRGLAPFWTYDEFWENLVVQPGAVPLAEAVPAVEHRGGGQPAPILFATELGRGRGFCLLLGHDVAAMRNPAFRTLLKRGTEWAASGAVTLPPDPGWPATEQAAQALTETPWARQRR